MKNTKNGKKILLNESYNYLKKSYDKMVIKQSSSESAPILFPNKNEKNSEIIHNKNQKKLADKK